MQKALTSYTHGIGGPSPWQDHTVMEWIVDMESLSGVNMEPQAMKNYVKLYRAYFLEFWTSSFSRETWAVVEY